MEYCLRRAFYTFNCFFNKLFTCLAKNLNCNIIRNTFFFNQAADKFILSVACCREPYLNFFKAKFYKQVKKGELCVYAHWINKRLVAVPQVYGAPNWRMSDC